MHIVRFDETILDEFKEFMAINMRLASSTVQHTVQDVRRFLTRSNFVASHETAKAFLRNYVGKAPKTYNGQVTSLRRFIKEFLRLPDVIASFKMAPLDESCNITDLTRNQVREGFLAQVDAEAKAIYLFTATTGLRKGEILNINRQAVYLETRTVIPKPYTRKKRSGVTFFDSETEYWLREYLDKRRDDNPKLFVISDRKWRQIWRQASKAAGTRITAQTLRAWFSTEMGELGVPDRYVDVFQGRAPRTVIAKHYTGKALERLKRIYEKADLKILH